MGYYLADYLVEAAAEDLATMIQRLLEIDDVVTVIVADLSGRANWTGDKKVETEDGLSPLVLFEKTYGESTPEDQSDNEKLAETGLLMMDREGTSLDVIFASLRQNIEAGDLFPSTDAVGLVAGHLAICVVGLKLEDNGQIMNDLRDRILAAIAISLSDDDHASESNYVAEGAQDDGAADAPSA
jgi:hypothetical protein